MIMMMVMWHRSVLLCVLYRQLEDKDRELGECRDKLTELTEARDTLLKQSNSTKRYLEALPSADEHAANLKLVNMSTWLDISALYLYTTADK